MCRTGVVGDERAGRRDRHPRVQPGGGHGQGPLSDSLLPGKSRSAAAHLHNSLDLCLKFRGRGAVAADARSGPQAGWLPLCDHGTAGPDRHTVWSIDRS
jgi:hypothetical protein